MNPERGGPRVADRDPPGAAQRNRYFRGKLLTVADYAAEQLYHIERRRLINRAIHGWGIVSGLAVQLLEEGGLRISPGMAFDRQGRELVADDEVLLESEADLLWLGEGGRIERPEERPAGAETASYLLSAHYAELRVDGVRIEDGWGDSVCEANRVCETLVFSLARAESSEGDRESAPDDDLDPGTKGRLARVGGVDVALDSPVPLGRVTVRFDQSGGPVFAGVDGAFQPRRLGRSAPPAPIRTGGGLQHVPVRVAVDGAAPDQALEIERLTKENERLTALLRQAGEGEAARPSGDPALADMAALDAADELRRAMQARHQAEADLAALKAEAEAGPDKLRLASKAREEAEAELARLRAEAKAADDAQARLKQAIGATEEAQTRSSRAAAARETAATKFQQAMDALQEARKAPAPLNSTILGKQVKDLDAAQAALARAIAEHEKVETDLARLKAEEQSARADAEGKAAGAPEAIEAAQKRMEAAAKEQRGLEGAAEKPVAAKSIEAAEKRVAAAKRDEESAQQKADAAREEVRRRAEGEGK